jgi:hypothetical protein
MDNTNTTLWQSVEKTDPAFTKQFSRGGGFKGTATNATYLARKATEQFGPCGIGWGVQVIDEEIIEGAPLMLEGQVVAHERIHKVRARLWYVRDGERGEVEQFGQTQMVGKNKNGFYTDEEAPKKSLTDAMSKCLSLLGFSADIHLGLYDDNKYVATLQAEFAPRVSEEQAATLRDLITKSNADEAGFLAYFGAESISAVPAARYAEAKAMLEAKLKKAA